MRLLLVEDDVMVASGIKLGLTDAGYAVDWVGSAERALEVAHAESFDIAVIDVGLPAMDGLALTQTLRKNGHTMPVLMLTARSEVTDRIHGLDHGADDYLGKPFDLDELIARLRALIRRSAGKASPVITIGDIVIDPITRRVSREGDDVVLTAREYALIEFMGRHRGRVISRTELYEHVFDENDDTLSNLIDVHVSNLRKKLRHDLITTRRGHGYCIE